VFSIGVSDQPAGDSMQLAPPLLQKNHFAYQVKESLAALSCRIFIAAYAYGECLFVLKIFIYTVNLAYFYFIGGDLHMYMKCYF
jgi:hypothetical protein